MHLLIVPFAKLSLIWVVWENLLRQPWKTLPWLSRADLLILQMFQQMLKIRRNALKSCGWNENKGWNLIKDKIKFPEKSLFIKPVLIIGYKIQYTHNCCAYLAIFCFLKISLKIKISPWNLLEFQNPNSVNTLYLNLRLLRPRTTNLVVRALTRI